MSSEDNNQDLGDQGNGAGEGESQDTSGTISVPKEDWEKTQRTLGSLKRQLKDLTKPKEEATETPVSNQPDTKDLGQLAFLRSAGIANSKEVDLALSTAKKWGVSLDELVDDADFQAKLEKLRTSEANAAATSNVQGGAGNESTVKEDPAYWIAKGVPPTADQVPSRAARAKIARAMIATAKTGGKKFYND